MSYIRVLFVVITVFIGIIKTFIIIVNNNVILNIIVIVMMMMMIIVIIITIIVIIIIIIIIIFIICYFHYLLFVKSVAALSEPEACVGYIDEMFSIAKQTMNANFTIPSE